MSDTAILSPTPHKQDEGLSTAVNAAAERDEVVQIERRVCVHREVNTDALPTAARQGGRHHAHEWVISGKCRAAEFEASRHELLCARFDQAFPDLLVAAS
eukprot:CAMPEP_0170646196 /NCGR_PEP_ID=MMETSP0224-20130122/43502_1 /TAXON_ID=285029 /ORGANISM="Togula jolla, Strain CCCM 725" /LENGTH=99 /DNA_ID=CAMNT_0010977499 /DNA_START=270 /DNA_END=569 /DNA_ORIENTATION=+